MFIKQTLKKLIPKKILNLRHLFFAWYGAVKYRHPSEELFVIGITGTSGKSTTVFLLRQLLEAAGYTVGSLSTIDFYIAGENKLNDQKMTMLGKTAIQKYLREMVDKQCDIAIVETTSEGRVQHRHRFINYDMMLLTNLYPEHIESHGGFDNYKQAKVDLFEYTGNAKHKKQIKHIKPIKQIENKVVPKTAIVNGESEYAREFLQCSFDNTYIFGREKQYNSIAIQQNNNTTTVSNISVDKTGLHFAIDGHTMNAPMFGEHNVMNILAAVTVAKTLGISWNVITKVVSLFQNVPGRCEFIREAEKRGFQVIVDYAFEPKAIAALYHVVDLLQPKRIIHIFGSTGGGRDVERRFTVGSFVAQRADVCIVTDEDPYDDDPVSIMNDVASAVRKEGKKDGEGLFVVLDRKEAVRTALQLARSGDLVLLTGKGSEQKMCVAGGKMIPWDDRTVVREVLADLPEV